MAVSTSGTVRSWRAGALTSLGLKLAFKTFGWEVMSTGVQDELNRRLITQIAPGGDVAVDGLRLVLGL
jgi:hypothetical protein